MPNGPRTRGLTRGRLTRLTAGFVLGCGLFWYLAASDRPGLSGASNSIMALAVGAMLGIIAWNLGRK